MSLRGECFLDEQSLSTCEIASSQRALLAMTLILLSLHSAQCNPFDELFLSEEKYNQKRQDADQSSGHQHSELAAIFHLFIEESEANRQHRVGHRRHIHERMQQIVPGALECKDGKCCQRRPSKRHINSPKDLDE